LLQVPVTKSSFGELAKIGLGVLDPAVPVDSSELNCLLRKVAVTNKDTEQYYA